MNDFNIDDELKRALGRQPAPPDFTNQVLARAAQQKQTTSVGSSVSLRALCGEFFSLLRPLRWATASALAIALIVEGVHYLNVRKERAEGEAAKARLVLALRIAGSKLQLARTKVQQLNDDGSGAETQQEKE
jgi:hypothetical protein